MAPRPYDSSKRQAAAAETRRRILEASYALHSRQGVAATTWQDIAKEADVAIGTVYYHFPTYDDLVPACAALASTKAPAPTPAIFEGLRSTRARIERLVSELFRSYAAGGGATRFLLAERSKIPIVASMVDEMLAYTRTLVRAALGDDADDRTVATVAGLVDYRVWDSLHEQGLDLDSIGSLVTESIRRVIASR